MSTDLNRLRILWPWSSLVRGVTAGYQIDKKLGHFFQNRLAFCCTGKQTGSPLTPYTTDLHAVTLFLQSHIKGRHGWTSLNVIFNGNETKTRKRKSFPKRKPRRISGSSACPWVWVDPWPRTPTPRRRWSNRPWEKCSEIGCNYNKKDFNRVVDLKFSFK